LSFSGPLLTPPCRRWLAHALSPTPSFPIAGPRSLSAFNRSTLAKSIAYPTFPPVSTPCAVPQPSFQVVTLPLPFSQSAFSGFVIDNIQCNRSFPARPLLVCLFFVKAFTNSIFLRTARDCPCFSRPALEWNLSFVFRERIPLAPGEYMALFLPSSRPLTQCMPFPSCTTALINLWRAGLRAGGVLKTLLISSLGGPCTSPLKSRFHMASLMKAEYKRSSSFPLWIRRI